MKPMREYDRNLQNPHMDHVVPAEMPSAKKAWYMVFVLMIAFTLAFIDRIILSLLVDDIKADLAISDTQISYLHGFAFVIFYATLGIPIARLADTKTRKNIIAIGIAMWSIFTALCGCAQRYWQLFTFRVGVGIGEAALSPSAFSMITDSFPKSRLGLAISVYSMGGFVGAGIALLIGGWIIGALTNIGAITLPLLGTLQPWQLTFIAVGLPGLLVALWAWLLREPPRKTHIKKHTSIGELKDHLIANCAAYSLSFLGFSFLVMLNQSIYAWTPAYLMRLHGLTATEAGTFLGLATVVFGSAGILSGGYLSDLLVKRGDIAGTLKVGIIAAACVLPLAVIAPLMKDLWLTLVLYCPLSYFISFPFGAASASVQWLAPSSLRAQISALYLFTVNLIGLGMGPTLTAYLTDYFFQSENLVGYSMAIMGFMAPLLAIICLYLAVKPFKKALAAD